MYPISKLGTEVKEPDDLPLNPHWQIWVQEKYTRYTGYEEESGVGGQETKWRTFVYLDREEWSSDLLELHERAMDPKRTYGKDLFLAFEAGGRVEARVSIHLVGKPPAPRG
jgi:hypothetical protein